MEQRISRLVSAAEENGTLPIGVVAQFVINLTFFVIVGVLTKSPAAAAILTVICSLFVTYIVMMRFKNTGYEWASRRPRFLEGFVFAFAFTCVVAIFILATRPLVEH